MGKFVIGSSSEGYRFLIETFKGEILGISPFYETEDDARKVIKGIKDIIADAKIYDETNEKVARRSEPRFLIREDSNNMFRFSFVKGKDTVCFSSPSYASFRFCADMATSVKSLFAETC